MNEVDLSHPDITPKVEQGVTEGTIEQSSKVEQSFVNDLNSEITKQGKTLDGMIDEIENPEKKKELGDQDEEINNEIADAAEQFEEEKSVEETDESWAEMTKFFEDLGDDISLEELKKWEALEETQRKEQMQETQKQFEEDLALTEEEDVDQKMEAIQKGGEALNQVFNKIITEYQEALEKERRVNLQDPTQVEKINQMFNNVGEEAALYVQFLKGNYVQKMKSGNMKILDHPLLMSSIRKMENLAKLQGFKLQKDQNQLGAEEEKEISDALYDAIMTREGETGGTTQEGKPHKNFDKWWSKAKTGGFLAMGALGWFLSTIDKKVMTPKTFERFFGMFLKNFKIPQWVHNMYTEKKDK